MGFLADTIIWDFSIAADRAAGAGEGKSGDIILQRLSQHKVKVQDLSFSPNGKYIVTLGGQDDNQLLLWSVNSGRCLCGTPAANDASTCVAYFNNDNDRLITCGNYNLRVWEYGKESRKLIPVDVAMGQVQRVYKSIAINAADTSAFVGTMSGDLFEIDLRPKVPTFIRASKEKFSQGIVSITLPARGVLIGTGAGVVAGLGVKLKTVCKAKLLGGVTSIAPVFNDGELAGLYMGTNQSNIYFSPWNATARTKTIIPELRASCHFNPIKDIIFPQNYSRVFITTAGSDIRVWNAVDRRELLRIQVPNLECHCINLTADGSLILSGWSDGKVRAFYPESGSVKFVIHDAHALGVTAVNATSRGDRVITGGADGKVRFWDVNSLKMISSLSEHKTKVGPFCLLFCFFGFPLIFRFSFFCRLPPAACRLPPAASVCRLLPAARLPRTAACRVPYCRVPRAVLPRAALPRAVLPRAVLSALFIRCKKPRNQRPTALTLSYAQIHPLSPPPPPNHPRHRLRSSCADGMTKSL
jgi:WD40 repeat protein